MQTSEKQLKPRQYYVDRYDRLTIERCRLIEGSVTLGDVKKHAKKKASKQELDQLRRVINELQLYFVKGEMYREKESTINQWMREDSEKDKLLELAKAPAGVTCHTCRREMFVSYKQLEDTFENKPRVLFMYDCTLGHLPRRVFYDNGEAWSYEKPTCEKCGSEVEEINQDTNEFFKTIQRCESCGNENITEIERTATKQDKDPNFEKDKKRFCDEAEGTAYIDQMHKLKRLNEIFNKQKEKDKNKELYDRVEKIRRLSVPQVKDLLTKAIEKGSYANLVFKEPAIEKIVTINFTVEDPTERSNYDSRIGLSRILKKSLADTSWRLMSNGVSYRLGILSGKIRAYENEDDLVRLLSKRYGKT